MRFARRLCGWGLGLGIMLGTPAAHAADLEIVNASMKAINHLYLAPSGEKKWGRDLLMSQSVLAIPAGESRMLKNIMPATYDLRLVDEDGAEIEVEGIEVESNMKVEFGDTQLAMVLQR